MHQSLLPLGRRRRVVPRRGHARSYADDERLGDVLRRQRRLRHDGRRLRVRQPVLDWVRNEHGGAEHCAFQRRVGLRGVLPGQVRPVLLQVVQAGRDGDHHGDEPVSPGLLEAEQQRRLVQPAPQALRHGPASLGEDRCLPRRHRASRVPKGVVLEERRGAVHDQREQLLRAGAHLQRGRTGLDQEREDQGLQDGVDDHVPELGRQLAVQQLPQRPVHLLLGHRHQRQDARLPGRRAEQLAIRPDLHQLRPVLLATRAPARGRARVHAGAGSLAFPFILFFFFFASGNLSRRPCLASF